MNTSVAAVVVLFKPDLIVLDRLLLSIYEQVQLVYIIDNTPGSNIEDYAGRFDDRKLFYKSLHDNYGIARAHNVGAQLAESEGYSHVLLLDQDSELLPGTVQTLLAEEKKLLDKGVKVGAIGPVFVDEKTGDAAPILRPSFFGTKKIDIDLSSKLPVLSNYIIASGSLIRVCVFKVVGLMQEDLFIDWVDIEWGERASSVGYGSYLTPFVTMRHSIGDEFVTLMGKRITLHSDFRNYFIVRNAAYLAIWSKARIQTRLEFARKVPYYIICYTLCSKRRFYSAKLLCQALYDGVAKNMFKGRF